MILTMTTSKLPLTFNTLEEPTFLKSLPQLREILSLNLCYGIEHITVHSSTLRYV